MLEHLPSIDRREALRYLRIRGGSVPPDLEDALARCERELMSAARPRAVWRLFDREANGRLSGTGFVPAGESIRRHLSGCGQVILMAATLGSEAESLLRRAQIRDMGDALILDALGSAAIEGVCDRLCEEIAQELSPRRLTARFSPGYGDLPLGQQRELFAVLDVTRRIGVSLSESGLMLPQKSVTALIGVKHPIQQGEEQRESI